MLFVLLWFPVLVDSFFFSSTSDEPTISKAHPDGQINLYRNLFTDSQKEHLRDFRTGLFRGSWRYYDHEDTPPDGVSWQLPLNASLLTQSPLWRKILQLLPAKDMGTSQHVDAKARVLRRGDHTRIHNTCNRETEDGYSILLFLSKLEGSNSYGEILFFAKDDVHTTIQPAQFSLLTWPCRTPYQFQYPAITSGFGQVLVQITLYDRVDVTPRYLPHSVAAFPNYLPGIPSSLRARDHLTATHWTALNRPIYVLDHLIPQGVLSGLLAHVYSSSQYYYDDSEDEGETDNVHWISGYRTTEFVQSNLWTLVRDTISQITGHEGWYPYDISCNLNRAWDHTRIHKDCYGQDEYTFLIFLTPDYGPGDLGGTAFYQHEDLSEIVTLVQNRYGRVALFHCEIKHSARPPHSSLSLARYTFVVKVARSKLSAVQREMLTVVAHTQDLADESEAEQWVASESERLGNDPDQLESLFASLTDTAEQKRHSDLEDSLLNAGN